MVEVDKGISSMMAEKRIFDPPKEVQEKAVGNMEEVVKLNFYCSDMLDIPEIVPVLRDYFCDHTLARTTAQIEQLAHSHTFIGLMP